jgi:hypothetical protein
MVLAAKLAARELGPVVFEDTRSLEHGEDDDGRGVDGVRPVPSVDGSAEGTGRMTVIFFRGASF